MTYLLDVQNLDIPFDGWREPQTPEEMEGWLARYRIGGDGLGVERFAYEVCRATRIEGDWQPELFRARGQGEQRISVTSGHGVGKSGGAGIVIVQHHVVEVVSRTAVTAPTEKQMFNVLYPEVLKWLARCPEWVQAWFTTTGDRVAYTAKLKDWYASFATARAETPEALAGVHLAEGSVLLVADEASGVHEKVFESASGSMSGHNTCTMLFGNPTRTAGLFFDSHHKLKRDPKNPRPGDWYCIQVNAETCGRVSQDFIEDMARRYGKDSNQYRVRVQGKFPTTDADTIIPYEHVLSAQTRDIVEPKDQAAVWGLDVARFGDDRTCLVKRRGKVVYEVPLVWQGKDTMQVAALVHAEWNSTSTHQRPKSICVDSIGLGAGVVDRLRALGLPVRGVNVSEMSSNQDVYANLKAELWLKTAKNWFAAKDCKIPEDDTRPGGIALGAELALPKFRFLPSGKFQVESKAEIKKRGFPSTDIADAFILTMADTDATYIHGSQQSTEPLKRSLKCVL